ncbi:MAG: hypothetical protein RL497_639 [Pseudomonadota bacterium]|jgi:hypothetical protein
MRIPTILRSFVALAITATAIDAVAVTGSAGIYDPANKFLTRKASSFTSAAEVAVATRLYYEKVIVDEPGYLVPKPVGQSAIDAAMNSFTLTKWKELNGFSQGADVVSDVKYFNGVDLGLGRNMTCVNQTGNATANRTKGMACFVSSHGKIDGTMRDNLAALNSTSFAAVAMEYRPTAENNKVRFFVFDKDGKILYPPGNTTEKAFYEFDTGKSLRISGQTAPGQPVPGVCLACHGGSLNKSTGLITGAHFLPFDTFALDFPNANDRSQIVLRDAQGNALAAQPAAVQFNKLNRWIYRAELHAYPYVSNSAQSQIIDYLKGSYDYLGEQPLTVPDSEIHPEAQMSDNYVDARFAPVLEETGLPDPVLEKAYKSVIRPYCRGCHIAGGNQLTPEDWKMAYACDPASGMPHSETASKNLYRHHAFVQPILNAIPAVKDDGDICKKTFTLTDFEGRYPSRRDLFNYTVGTKVGAGATTDTTLDPNIAKRTLRVTGSNGNIPLYLKAIPVGGPDKGQLVSLSFEYVTPLAQDSISLFNGGVLNSATTNPLVPGTTFKVATDTAFGATSTYTANLKSLRTIVAGSKLVEVDNILSEWIPNTTSKIQRADFEDQTHGDFGIIGSSIGGSGTCDLSRTRFDLGFDVSQRFKLSDDSGRYAYSTARVLCANETATANFALTGAANETAILSFNYETLGSATVDTGRGTAQITYVNTAGATVTKYLHQLTQENLDAYYGPGGGNVRVNDMRGNSEFSISFKAKTGTATNPNPGMSIDNISVTTN